MAHKAIRRRVGRRGVVGPFCGAVDVDEECCGQLARVDDCALVNVLVLVSGELDVGFRFQFAKGGTDI